MWCLSPVSMDESHRHSKATQHFLQVSQHGHNAAHKHVHIETGVSSLAAIHQSVNYQAELVICLSYTHTHTHTYTHTHTHIHTHTHTHAHTHTHMP